jgi:outer membrane protein assembly factor BamD (BamD/ComL family)
MARRAALARILYLFQDGQFAQVCDEAAAYGKKPELAACRARLLYARWLASLRLGRSTEEQSLRATFLAEFPDDPMVPKMLYCLLCRALAGGDPDQAAGYMDRIEKRYPQSEATAHVREIRRAMAQERGDGAGREQGH